MKDKDETAVAVVAESGKAGMTAEESRSFTKTKLSKMPKVDIRIPLPAGMSDEDAKSAKKPPNVVVGINGYNYHIQRGVSAKVPLAVQNVLRRSNLI